MPNYDYRCKSCNCDVTIERSMTDESTPVCVECGSEDMNRLWTPVTISGRSAKSAGQGKPTNSAPARGGCGSGACGGGGCH